MRIIFLGTPDFAVASLQALVEAKKNVVAVVTMPDKKSGRGNKIQQSPVKEYALKNDLPLLQPTNLKDADFLKELKSYNADIQIVVAFRMLPKVVWDMPRLGTFNLHGSLLPQYRGAAPINWAIINGEAKTGITTFFLKQEIDTGNILKQKEVTISENDNVGLVHDKLMEIGADMVVETLGDIEKGIIEGKPQDEYPDKELKKAPKIFNPDCKVNWNLGCLPIHNKIRGLDPYPAAFTRIKLGEKELGMKLFFPTKEFYANSTPKKVVQIENKFGIETTDGIVWITELQLEGKRRMKSADFLRGISEKIEVI